METLEGFFEFVDKLFNLCRRFYASENFVINEFKTLDFIV